MKEERIAYFTNKISSSNATQLVCVLYEIYFEYIDEATSNEALEKEALRMANTTLEHLKNALNFKYEISANLYSLYDFCQRRISMAIYKHSAEPLEAADMVMRGLYSSFLEVAKADDSPPMMQNTQQVSVGMTYGRSDLVESTDSTNRGFLA